MKKHILLALAGLILACTTACGGAAKQTNTNTQNQSQGNNESSGNGSESQPSK